MENFLNLAKEIDFQEVQEAQRDPKKLDPRKHTRRHIIITLPKIKDKERILKAARAKEAVTYKGVPMRLSASFSKENFPNLKEIDFQEVQEAQRVPKRLDPRKHTSRHIIITLPKVKDKEGILKAAREKETVTYKEVPVRLSADFSKETLQARSGWKEVFQVMKGPTSKITLSSKALI